MTRRDLLRAVVAVPLVAALAPFGLKSRAVMSPRGSASASWGFPYNQDARILRLRYWHPDMGHDYMQGIIAFAERDVNTPSWHGLLRARADNLLESLQAHARKQHPSIADVMMPELDRALRVALAA